MRGNDKAYMIFRKPHKGAKVIFFICLSLSFCLMLFISSSVFKLNSNDTCKESIVFTAPGVGGRADLFSIDTDRLTIQNLTGSPAYDGTPSSSHNGNVIAFSSTVGNENSIYIMDSEGHNKRKLIDDSGIFLHPSWSPDDKKIVFTHVSDKRIRRQLKILDVDGEAKGEVLEIVIDSNVLPNSASWINDNLIVFDGMDVSKTTFHIYSVDLDGFQIQNLTPELLKSANPSPLPNAEELSFIAWTEELESDVYVMSIDGKNKRKIDTRLNGEKGYHSWSSNGRKIAFFYGDYKIYVLDLITSKLEKLVSVNDIIGDETKPKRDLTWIKRCGTTIDGTAP